MSGAATGLTLRVTLLTFLLFPVGEPAVRAGTQLIAVAGILHPTALRAPWTWLALFLLTGWRVLEAWPLADNHAYLLVYWCLAVTLARAGSDPVNAQARSARTLVALVFVFAVAWKLVLSDEYLDGTFYRVLLLGDRRFEWLTLLVGGLDRAALDEARRFLELGTLGGVAALVEPLRFRVLAGTLTWATFVVETLVAALWALRLPHGAAWLRHAALLVFCAGAYAVAPVAGFGWLLLTMGLACTTPADRPLRLAYVSCLGLMIVYRQLLD